MESGSPSFRADAFPAGLRVLVVDDDPTWLKILEKMLKKCSYEVTTCGLARVALDLLRGKRDRFDIVISDVNMPDMDGFKLLEQLGLEMDLPVIMMSVDGETSRVMRGVQHGACDYLLKPVRMKELQNIWQHVFRRRMHEAKDLECRASNEDTQIMRKMLNEFDNGSMLTGSDSNCTRKRKTTENEEHDDQDFNDTSSGKKTRLVWSMDLHQKFFNAVNQIGYEKVGPKKILDLMNVPGLTRENVASHLQKYRLYLSRLQKQNESEISLCGANQSDCNLNDYLPKFDLQNPTKSQQNLAASFGYAGNKSLVQMGGSEPHENELNSMADLLPLTEERKAFAGDAKKTRKVKNASHAKLGVLQKPNYMSPPQGWCSEVSVSQESTYNLFEKGCSSLGMPGFYQIHVDHRPVTQCVDAENYITDRDKADISQDRALYTDCRNMNERNTSTKSWEFSSTKFNPASDNRWFPSNKSIKISGINDKELSQNPENAIGLPLTSLEDFQQISDKEYDCSEEVAINIDLLDYYDPASIIELTSQSYDALRLGCENIWDPMEYTIIDEGLFIM